MDVRRPLSTALLFTTAFFASAQLNVAWQRSFGGTGLDEGRAIARTSDGGYFVTGTASSSDGDVTGAHGNGDLWVVRLNSSGTLQWQKTFGGAFWEEGADIVTTTDGGCIIAGQVQSEDGDISGYHGAQDLWVVKVSSSGSLQWQKCLGGTNFEYGFSVVQTSNGYVVAGSSASDDGDITDPRGAHDAWVVKLSTSGTIQWQHSYGGSGWDSAYCIKPTSDAGYIVCGYSESNDGDVAGGHGGKDMWVLKLNGIGSLQWQKCIGGSGTDEGLDIVQTMDGGYAVVGNTSSTNGDVTGNHGSSDAWVVRLDGSGGVLWQKCLGGTSSEFGVSIHAAANGSYLVGASTTSSGGDVTGQHGATDFWLLELNASGDLTGQGCAGGSDHDVPYAMVANTDGSVTMAGYASSLDGDVSGPHGARDYWVAELELSGTGITDLDAMTFNVAPNPATGPVDITWPADIAVTAVRLMDMTGRNIHQVRVNGTRYTLDVAGLPQGLYTLSLSTAQGWTRGRSLVVQ